MGSATYLSPPKSYTAVPRQVLEATTPLSRYNHKVKSLRKAERKNGKNSNFQYLQKLPEKLPKNLTILDKETVAKAF